MTKLVHNGLYQDEREYLREMLAAGAGTCLDAVGYHNYGYSAGYDTPPDTNGGTPETNCTNGFCFRGAEKIYEIMVANGLANTDIWTTEYGWITDPAAEGLGECKENDPGWAGREWQIVSQAKQAENLAGSFEYATENWPWMGAMFAFNLNFNEASYYDDCEQMRFYSLQGRPAETALRDIPKYLVPPISQLELSGSPNIIAMLPAGDLPTTLAEEYMLTNSGTAPLSYTISVNDAAAVVPTLSIPLTRSLTAGESVDFTLEIEWTQTKLGSHNGMVTVDVAPAQPGFSRQIPLRVIVVERVERGYLPLVLR